MGITGLIPFLKAASRPVNVKEYSGCTVAIDSYCWLHRGAISCAEKLVRGDDTDMYVNYCVKYVDMLLSHNVKPIMVFDGRYLPAKAETEKARRERRENNKAKAADLLRQDRPDEARNVMKACIDITPEMAFSLIKRCRAMGVDCIVAPFEADAQLAFLNIAGFAHIIITEDSDLLLFGCERVLFKMDLVGNGLLVEQTKLPLAMKVHPDRFSMDKFRHMCILSGCDYLASLPGIGLQKACKFIKRTAETNISRALTKLGAHLNMSNLVVSPDYREKFLVADSMFKHQPVFDPASRKVVPLTPIPEGSEGPQLETLPPDTSYQLALGNLNPFTLERFDNWDPDSDVVPKYRTNGWNKSGNPTNSIWSKSYVKPKPIQPLDRRKVDQPASTLGKVVVHVARQIEDQKRVLPPRKQAEEQIQELRDLYGIKSPPTKKCRLNESVTSSQNGSMYVESSDPEDEPSDMNTTTIEDEILGNLDFDDDIADVDDLMPTSPVLVGNKFVAGRNKFSCSKKLYSDSHESRGLASMRKLNVTQVDDSNIVCSRFFNSSQDSNAENKPIDSPASEGTSRLTDEQFGRELDRIIDERPSEGPRLGRLTDEEFATELDRICDGRSLSTSGKHISSLESRETKISGISGDISTATMSTPVMENPTERNPLVLSPLAEVSQLDKNLKLEAERPSLIARLDKMSQILSDKSPQKPVRPQSSSFNWQKKKSTQKSFAAYLSPGSSIAPMKPSSSKSKVSKSASKPSGLSKNKKPVVQSSMLENFGFKPKPKLNL